MHRLGASLQNVKCSAWLHVSPALPELSGLYQQNYIVLLDSTFPRSQYDYVLPQVSFTAVGYHKHITLVFSPTVSKCVEGMSSASAGFLGSP